MTPRALAAAAVCLAACRSESPPGRDASSDGAPRASTLASGGTPPAFVSEADALERVARLPEVRELGLQDFTPAHPQGLGRKVKPMVKCVETVDRAQCGERCEYVIDVIDVTEEGTPTPALRFYLDARTSALSLDASDPFPNGPMPYERHRALVQEQRLVVQRLFELPEMRAMSQRLALTKASPPCGKPELRFLPTSAPGAECKRGPGCAWVLEARTPNGCVASLAHTFEVDSPTGEIRVSDVSTSFEKLPLAAWRDKRAPRP